MRWRIEAYGAVGSTQDLVKARAGQSAAQGLVVQAQAQNAGRGRRGRAWDSPPGNLYMSVLLRPDCPAARAGELGLVAAVALAEALPGTRLKWPNDVLLGGRKCAGILAESEIAAGRAAWLALGIGVNIAASPPGCAAVPGEVATLRDAVLDSLARAYAEWGAGGFAPIRARWLGRCAHAPGQAVTAAGRTGAFAGMGADGALLLEANGATTRVITP